MKKNEIKLIKMYESNKNNSYTSVFKEIFKKISIIIHSDKISPFKRRMIQIIGKELFIEGDYINQTLNINGKNIKIKKQEPLKVELEHFLNNKFTNNDLKDAINNVRLLK